MGRLQLALTPKTPLGPMPGYRFSQEKPLRWKEINTHTHTRTHTSK